MIRIGLANTIFFVLASSTAVSAIASDPFAELDEAVSEQSAATASEQDDFKAWQQAQRSEFNEYLRRVEREFKAYRQMHQAASDAYRAEISETWKQPETSTNTQWVSYDDGYKRKTIVDFEQDEIRIVWPSDASESLSDSQLEGELQQLLTLTRKQAFEADKVAQHIEMQGRESLTAFETDEVPNTPILLSYLFGTTDVTAKKQTGVIKHFMAERKALAFNEAGQSVRGWAFPLTLPESMASGPEPKEVAKAETVTSPELPVSGASGGPIWQTKQVSAEAAKALPVKAKGLIDAINRENQAYDLSVELILAIIETESAFNPMAKSPIPAFGLMQIVPVSAGQDATAKIFGKPRILSPSYLYNTDNNVKVGAAYFNILFYRYFKGIDDPLSRLYCSIAAYNTGPGNVSKALTGNSMSLKAATRVANNMEADQIYQHLLANLPYEETVHYLRKVTSRLQKYEAALSTQEG